ncbi:TAXI family TRAP transporter solute-binding subunit [Pelagibius marinus]|uniref:TAXI family TRAP transporter solute-binding subunit n=1 Tax=Pelagibius marinus TaxID=2762760 RepID=UPI0018724BBD|nr:TAXI family TRAP transporter solute-binding subunit [Pelagibius marinus]
MAASSQMQAKMRRFFRTLWTQIAYVAPAILIVIAGFVFAYQFVRPAPPDRVVMATGHKDGAYFAYGQAYAERFSKEGFELELSQTAGSVDNLRLLTDEPAEVPVAFMQGGIGTPADYPALKSLGSIYFEPIWVFVRGATAPGRLTGLLGKRIAVGSLGSGTRAVALPLLMDNGVTGETSELVEIDGSQAIDALKDGTVDAAIFVGGATSQTIGSLLSMPGVTPMSFERADAYVRRHPYLSKVVLPMGTLDLAKNRPGRDLVLLAPTATIVVTPEMHPALVDLMLLTMQETHRQGGYLESPGAFPTGSHVTYPLAPAARRFYERGPPFLQRYLPFSAANLIDRLWVMILPLLTLLYPLFKILPPVYSWRMRARVNRWYKELEALDDRLNDRSITRAEATEQLDDIERSAEKVHVPAGFADRAYTLRLHIDYLRRKVDGRDADKAPPPEVG